MINEFYSPTDFGSAHLTVTARYLLKAIGLTPGGSSTVHMYTQTVHRYAEQNTHNNKNT